MPGGLTPGGRATVLAMAAVPSEWTRALDRIRLEIETHHTSATSMRESAKQLLAAAEDEEAAGRRSTAGIYFDEAITADPNNFEARIDYGALLGNLGKFSEAEVQFRKALELSPLNEVARKNLELLLHHQR